MGNFFVCTQNAVSLVSNYIQYSEKLIWKDGFDQKPLSGASSRYAARNDGRLFNRATTHRSNVVILSLPSDEKLFVAEIFSSYPGSCTQSNNGKLTAIQWKLLWNPWTQFVKIALRSLSFLSQWVALNCSLVVWSLENTSCEQASQLCPSWRRTLSMRESLIDGSCCWTKMTWKLDTDWAYTRECWRSVLEYDAVHRIVVSRERTEKYTTQKLETFLNSLAKSIPLDKLKLGKEQTR